MSTHSSKLRYAVIGVAGVGQHHIRFVHRHIDAEIVALVDPRQNELERAIKSNSLDQVQVNCYSKHSDLLRALDRKKVDAVSICTPHEFLFEIAADCIEAGLHIFIEKPFAMRLSDADRLLKLAKKNNVTVAVAYQYRTFNTPKRFKRIIDSGELGDISRVLWTWFEFRPQSYYSKATWRGTWAGAGGGLLMNQISHELDLMRWLFGEPIEVSATLSNQFQRSELEDIASVSIRFCNGIVATLQASMNQPHAYSVKQIIGDQGAVFIQQAGRSANNPDDDITYHLYSSLKGCSNTLEGNHAQPSVCVASKSQRIAVGLPEKRTWLRSAVARVPGAKTVFRLVFKKAEGNKSPSSGHGKLVDDFISSIRNRHSPLVSGEDARETLQLINAVIMSAVQKRAVSLPLDPAQYDVVFDSLVSGSARVDID